MSIGLQILEGLANLDEGYANRRAAEKRDEKQNTWQKERDLRLNEMQLKRDQLLAAEQAVRDARLHGNAMEMQKAQIDADRVRLEFQQSQENMRQHEALSHQSSEAGKQRKFLKGERKGTQKFQSIEAGKERDWRTGERLDTQDFQNAERLGTQNWRSMEGEKERTFQSSEADKGVTRDAQRDESRVQADLKRTRGIHSIQQEAETGDIVKNMPPEVPIEKRYELARKLKLFKSVAPALMEEDKIAHPERYTPEGWRFDPRANNNYRDNPSAGMGIAPKGTGMTIKDLLNKQVAPPPAEPEPGSMEWLRKQFKPSSIQ